MNHEQITEIKTDFSILMRTTQWELARVKRFNRILLTLICISLFLNFFSIANQFPMTKEEYDAHVEFMTKKEKKAEKWNLKAIEK